MSDARLLELDRLAAESVTPIARRRFAWEGLVATEGRPFVALVGPRGSGKTVLLRQLRERQADALYVSADTLGRESLFDVVKRFHDDYRVNRFFLDEIHFVPDYPRQLKQIYDFLPVRLWLTSSVALSLDSTAWDLSRRVERRTLLPFSYREYLVFCGGPDVPPLSLSSVLTEPIPAEYLRLGDRFAAYVRGGLYPFMLEPGASPALFRNVLEKVVRQDIPRFDPTLSAEDVDSLERTVEYIARCPVDGVNYSSIASNLGVTKYKAQKYLDYLQRSFVVTLVFPAGTNVLKEPKVLLQLPYRLVYEPYGSAIGALREEFFAIALRQHGAAFSYAKSTRGGKTPDYMVDLNGMRAVVEIGGQGKGRSQFKGLDYDRKVVLTEGGGRFVPGERAPLHCVGFA
jgi:predicted AAA+ superfamily ATPase